MAKKEKKQESEKAEKSCDREEENCKENRQKGCKEVS